MLRVTVVQVPGARVRARRDGAAWEVKVERLQALQQLAVTSVSAGAIRSLEVTVDRWRPPIPGWLGRPGLPGLMEISIEPKGTGVRVSLVAVEPVDPALLLAAAVRCLRPVPTGGVGPLVTFAPGLSAAASCMAGHLHDVLLPDESRDAHVRRSDVLLAP